MTILGIILFILIVVGIAVLIYKSSDEIEATVFMTVILAVILFLVFFGFGCIKAKYEKSNVFGVTYISSISANSNVSGDFFLGSGTIDSKNYYYFVVNSDFGYQISKIEITNQVYLREDGDNNPFIEYTKYNCTYQNWFSRIFFKKSFFNEDREIIIHVPKNTIIKNYNVDINKL